MKKQMPMIIKSKRHFQLLEVMVAVFLILLCAVPALEVYTNMYKQQAFVNLAYKKDHLVRLIHSHLVEKLANNEIALEEIFQGREFDVNQTELKKALRKIGYEAHYQFKITFPKNDSQQLTKNRLLAEMTIQMKKKKGVTQAFLEKGKEDQVTDYTYSVYIDRGYLVEDDERDDNDDDVQEPTFVQGAGREGGLGGGQQKVTPISTPSSQSDQSSEDDYDNDDLSSEEEFSSWNSDDSFSSSDDDF
jgi:Tfp pilus assembly major pilin PilA